MNVISFIFFEMVILTICYCRMNKLLSDVSQILNEYKLRAINRNIHVEDIWTSIASWGPVILVFICVFDNIMGADQEIGFEVTTDEDVNKFQYTLDKMDERLLSDRNQQN